MKTIPKIRSSGKTTDQNVQNSRRGNSGRLSKKHLRDLRNNIPIRGLIENQLGVRCHTESGIFRFECPVCGSFHTSVLKSKNLGRCFECEINFNPIDMVIAVKKTDFRQSADFLTNLLESGISEKPSVPRRGSSDLVSLSSVLSSVSETSPETGDRRIQSLEKEIRALKNRTDRLQQVLITILSRKGEIREIGKIDR